LSAVAFLDRVDAIGIESEMILDLDDGTVRVMTAIESGDRALTPFDGR